MRVVGGAWKGRPLVAPPGRATRPTADRVREAVFDVLQTLPQSGASLAGQSVLDLYAGSGALGIEALSRGADACTFVERDRAALAALRRNLAALGVPVVAAGGRAGEAGRDRASEAAGGRASEAARAATPGAPGDVRGGDAAPAARVAALPVARALQADARAGCMYTLVLADPPYAACADAQDVLSRLLGPVLAPQAVIVLETSLREDVVLPWLSVRVKTYGDTKVTFMVAA